VDDGFRKMMQRTMAVGEDGVPCLLHTGLCGGEDPTNFHHFSTRSHTKHHLSGVADADILSAWIDLKNPMIVQLDDFPDDSVILLRQAEQEGHDGLCLHIVGQDPIWMVLDESQIYRHWRGKPDETLDPWDVSEDDWVGPSMIMDVFEIDGRSEEFDHLFEALEEEADTLAVIARRDGWTVRWIDDWEPEGTVGLYGPSGAPSGFYMNGMAWLDENVRGQGLSSLMINAVANLHGGSPTQNTEGLGYSDAGYQAHIAAHRHALECRPSPVSDERNFYP